MAMDIIKINSLDIYGKGRQELKLPASMLLIGTVLFLPLLAAQGSIKLESRLPLHESLIPCYNISFRSSDQIPHHWKPFCKKPTPYCDFLRNVCVKNPPQLSFYCEVDGIYPYGNSCGGSYSCSNGTKTDQPCPAKTYYNYKKKTCTRAKVCRLPDCRGKYGVFVKHPANPAWYAWCIGGLTASMRVCPVNYEFSADSNPPCEFVCRGVGLYPDVYHPQKFFNCTWESHKLKKKEILCPLGHVFEQKNLGIGFHCIPNQKHRPHMQASTYTSTEGPKTQTSAIINSTPQLLTEEPTTSPADIPE